MQIERSRQWLTEALIKQMKTTPFDRITITDIAAKAGVSRLTFYRNFESKEEILQCYFDTLFEEYKSGLSEDADLRSVLTHSFSYIQRESSLIRLMMKQNLTALIQRPFDDYFRRILKKVSLPRQVDHFQKRFLAGGVFFIMIDWIQDSKDLSPEEIADDILTLLNMKQGND
jgi:AcrR family transcriptional regulator